MPAPPGPAPHGSYEYLVIPKQPPVLPPAPFYLAFTAYQQVEAEIRMRMSYGDVTNLPDGSRIYRIPLRYLWRFDHDNFGAFIGRNPLPQYRFVLDDPTEGFEVEWVPL